MTSRHSRHPRKTSAYPASTAQMVVMTTVPSVTTTLFV